MPFHYFFGGPKTKAVKNFANVQYGDVAKVENKEKLQN